MFVHALHAEPAPHFSKSTQRTCTCRQRTPRFTRMRYVGLQPAGRLMDGIVRNQHVPGRAVEASGTRKQYTSPLHVRRIFGQLVGTVTPEKSHVPSGLTHNHARYMLIYQVRISFQDMPRG
jgi:hypothetical protein